MTQSPHVFNRAKMIVSAAGCAAVGSHDDPELAHVGILGSTHDAAVCRKYGVDQARRAGLEKEFTLNSLSWPDLARVLRR